MFNTEYLFPAGTDLKISRIGFGGCPMGGYGWGSTSEKEFLNAISWAIDHGITLFDTADVYGLGKSEQVLGKGVKGKRDNVVIADKFGVRVEKGAGTWYDNSPDYIYRAVDASLKNLGLDHIDIYQVHYLDGKTPLEDLFEALLRLKESGKVRYFGLSNISYADIEKVLLPPETVSFQVEYSLAKRDREEEIKMIIDKTKMMVWTWGSLGQGVLSGNYRENVAFGADDRRSDGIYVNFHEKLAKNLEIVHAMEKLTVPNGRNCSHIALRWILDKFPTGVALTGVKRIEQIEDNCGAFGWNLSPAEFEILDSVSRE